MCRGVVLTGWRRAQPCYQTLKICDVQLAPICAYVLYNCENTEKRGKIRIFNHQQVKRKQCM